MYSVLVTPPAEEPITLAEAKAQCRVTHTMEDVLIASYVAAARQWAEEYTWRAFVTQTWRMTLSEFPDGPIVLPRPPLIAVASVSYTDVDGVAGTVEDFQAETSGVGGLIYPAYNSAWPASRAVRGAAVVEYTAGYGAAAAVPEAIKQAIRLMVEHFNANRSAVVTGTIATALPLSAKNLLAPFRVRRIA